MDNAKIAAAAREVAAAFSHLAERIEQEKISEEEVRKLISVLASLTRRVEALSQSILSPG